MGWLFNAFGLLVSVSIAGTLVAFTIREARTLGKDRGRMRARAVSRSRTAKQARLEAALLRDAAKHAMTSLSIETYEQRLANKARLEAALAKLEDEAIRLDEDGKAEGG